MTLDRAAQALARGDALGALGLVGRLEDARALLLRGIAYAQMGDVELAKDALGRARGADPDALTAARVDAALADIAASTGEPREASRAALAAARALDALGDVRNAAMQRLVAARAEVLLGRLGEARHVVRDALARELPADVRAVALLTEAEIAVRELAASRAAKALADAKRALAAAPHALLARALAAQESELRVPVARVFERGETRDADLFAIEEVSRGDRFLVDACRRVVVAGQARVPLATRPVLFAILVSLARAWPWPVSRDALIADAFGSRKPNDSHRARLRVEIGRVRKVLAGIAEPTATGEGYTLASPRPVALLLPPTDDADARIAILLADGATWTAQSIADHAGVSKRTALRALAALVDAGRAVRMGNARDSRYASTGGRIASRMLLLGLVPTR